MSKPSGKYREEIQELTKQISSLKQQKGVREFEEKNAVIAELHGENERLEIAFAQLAKEAQETIELNQAKDLVVKNLTADCQDLGGKLQAVSAEYDERVREVQHLQSGSAQLQADNDKLKTELIGMAERVVAAQSTPPAPMPSTNPGDISVIPPVPAAPAEGIPVGEVVPE